MGAGTRFIASSGPIDRRLDARAAFAEPDRHEALLHRAGAEDDFIAILEPHALLAARQLDRLRPSRGDFREAGSRRVVRARESAAREQVAGLQVAAIARVVHE